MEIKLEGQEVRTCPYCDGKAKVETEDSSLGPVYRVRCKLLDCRNRPKTEWYSSLDGALDAWNTRKPLDRIAETLEDIKNKKYVSGLSAGPYEGGACHALDDAINTVKRG